MAIYYLLDVGHAAVAELYGVPVENFPQFVARWERSFNEADERTSDVGFDANKFKCSLKTSVGLVLATKQLKL